MRFDADAFGCTADGRYLEIVSIDAGSNTLHGPSGRLLATEIDKHIAIPGAVDMVATIAKLIDRKDVANTTISAGSADLTIVLGPNESVFVQRVHAGCRVVVQGAGPGAGNLVTSIVSVEDGGLTLVLATPATTAVTGATRLRTTRSESFSAITLGQLSDRWMSASPTVK